MGETMAGGVGRRAVGNMQPGCYAKRILPHPRTGGVGEPSPDRVGLPRGAGPGRRTSVAVRFHLTSMGFDKDDTRPIIHPRRPATRVNLWMSLTILIFLGLMGAVVLWLWRHPPL